MTSSVGDETLQGVVVKSAGKLLSIDESFSSESATIDCPIDVSALKLFFMTVDANAAVQFNVNGGPGDLSFNLAAGEAFLWHNTNGTDNPFGSTDIVSVQVDQNDSGVRVRIHVLTDPTP